MPTAPKLNPTLTAFIERQPMFFVATAARDGRVNVSPKGMDSLRVLAPDRCVWLNLSGSGNETAAHLLDSPRMTLMWSSFEDDPLILRAYGAARTIHPRDAEWATLAPLFPAVAGRRQIFDLAIDMVQTSCGGGVPVMRFEKDRAVEEIVPFFDAMGPEGVEDYWRRKNVRSIDGRTTGLFEDEG